MSCFNASTHLETSGPLEETASVTAKSAAFLAASNKSTSSLSIRQSGITYKKPKLKPRNNRKERCWLRFVSFYLVFWIGLGQDQGREIRIKRLLFSWLEGWTVCDHACFVSSFWASSWTWTHSADESAGLFYPFLLCLVRDKDKKKNQKEKKRKIYFFPNIVYWW